MKQYQTNEDGSFFHDNMTIPQHEGNRHYRRMMKEIADGEAEVLPYVAPVKTVDAARQEAYQEAGITMEKMAVALWEKIIEGKTDAETGIDDMQAARTLIKINNPKA